MPTKKITKDFTEGPIFFRITAYTLPIMLTGILQLLYNMADHIVVGRFSGDYNALNAIGSTGTLTNLIVNFLVGISTGAGILVAQGIGAKRTKDVSDTVHTAMTFALIGGIAFAAISALICEPILAAMGTKAEFIDKSILYFRIICIGIPASAFFNFGAAILRSAGDSRTPLVILGSTGIVNVGLNLLFVIVFKMAISGVAIATVVSQYLSAIAILTVFVARKNEPYNMSIKRYKFDTGVLGRTLKLGVPSGIQSAIFSVANIMIRTGVNSFPTTVGDAYTIASNIDGLTYTTISSFSHAAQTFTAQNYGAKKYDRIKKVFIFNLIQVVFVGVAFAQTELLFGRQLARLFIDPTNPNADEVISHTMDIITLILSTYFLLGIMDTFTGCQRGLGHALTPMIISVITICGSRMGWLFVVFNFIEYNMHSNGSQCYNLSSTFS